MWGSRYVTLGGDVCQVLDRTSRVTQLVSDFSVDQGFRLASHLVRLKGVSEEETQWFDGSKKDTGIQGSRAKDEDRTGEYHYNQSSLYSTES